MESWMCGRPNIRYTGNTGTARIGKYCTFENNVVIYTGGVNHNGYVTTFPFGHVRSPPGSVKAVYVPCTGANVTIGNDVWVGEDSVIFSGVTIGDGVIIAKGSHVVNDVPPYAIMSGNPARLVKFRFRPDQIETLLRIKWWTWSDAHVGAASHLLCSGDIDEFIRTGPSFQHNLIYPPQTG